MRGRLTFAKRRIEQTDSSPFRLFHADDFARSHQAFVNILPFPQIRLNRGLRVRSITFETQLPMPSKILLGHVSVESFNAIANDRLCHGALLWSGYLDAAFVSAFEFQTFKPFNRFAPFNPFLCPPPRSPGEEEVGVERFELFEHLNMFSSIPTLRSP